MKILALDYGLKRIGLAVTDTAHGIVFPKGIIENKSPSFVMEELQKIVTTEKIHKIVIGIPYDMTDEERSGQKAVTKTFYEEISNSLSIPVELFDERLTTRIATEKMKIFEKKKKGMRDDEIAAQVLLEGYLLKMGRAGESG